MSTPNRNCWQVMECARSWRCLRFGG
jgi:hypothetical protein